MMEELTAGLFSLLMHLLWLYWESLIKSGNLNIMHIILSTELVPTVHLITKVT